ncbi:MAG TPA: heterodisulfide reductase-related iron-sulfur binding cluster [Candidatus Binatus sp.]|nr:heterodisulfide reductase-related iron-sulfur binding cluster [Candidatus Binatus sp.]
MSQATESGSPEVLDPAALAVEAKRVYDICAGCRRCYNLCPSFTYLLDTADERHDGDGAALSPEEDRRVVDLCFGCQLCYPHCPYTPPHRWALDFPRLMLHSRVHRAAAEGLTLRDRVLGNPELLGRLGSAVPWLANWANRRRPVRWAMERFLGIDRRRRLPRYASRFSRWFRRQTAPPGVGRNGKAALFYTTPVEFTAPETGRAAVQVLWRNGVEVVCPDQVCCGMPALDGGDVKGATRRARRNIESLGRAVDAGCDIVVPGPTCSRMLKQEYGRLVPGDATERVVSRVYDLAEYLMRLGAEGRLDRDFKASLGKVAYQVPCHLRVQEIGFKSRDLLRLVPGTQVDLLERCTGMDGTWGFKREFYEESCKVARPLLRDLEASAPDLVVSDCPLAALQMEQASGRRVYHPVEAFLAAYEGRPPAR